MPLFYEFLCESFRKLGVPYFGVLILRILLLRVLYPGPRPETPMWSLSLIQTLNWYMSSRHAQHDKLIVFPPKHCLQYYPKAPCTFIVDT